MKFGFLIYSYFPYGGQQRDFYRIVQECVKRNHEVVVYTRKWQGDRLDGIEIKFIRDNSRSRIRVYRQFTRRVIDDLKINPCDIVVGFNKMPGLDVYFAADPCFAEKAEHQRGAYYRFTPRYRHFMEYESAVFGPHSRTRALILSSRQRQAFEKYYPGCGSRLYEVPPGIDEDRKPVDATSIRRDLRAELALNDNDLLVLQIGSGFRVKGVDRSLLAVASLPDELQKRVNFLLIGQDRPARYLRQARRLGIAQRFRVFPGRDDVPRFLAGGDLLLHPAYSESAGYVLLEATIAGLPVLTTSTCGYASHVLKAGSGLVCGEPFRQSELNDNLRLMLTSDQRDSWRQNGMAYGKQDILYSMPRVAADYLESFARAMG